MGREDARRQPLSRRCHLQDAAHQHVGRSWSDDQASHAPGRGRGPPDPALSPARGWAWSAPREGCIRGCIWPSPGCSGCAPGRQVRPQAGTPFGKTAALRTRAPHSRARVAERCALRRGDDGSRSRISVAVAGIAAFTWRATLLKDLENVESNSPARALAWGRKCPRAEQ
jgi:hypothetical protein